jgi:RNA 3'-terminal phosphate cyclase (ATP)
MNWPASTFQIVEHSNSSGPGFSLSAEVAHEHITETFVGFGQKGVRTEQVAGAVVDQARAYHLPQHTRN